MLAKRMIGLLLIALMVMAALPALAQEDEAETPPFMQLLGLVPASAAVPPDDGGAIYISYADYRALEQVREGVPSPETLADLEALWDADAPEGELWIQNMARLSAGWADYGTYLRAAAGLMPEVVGFDFLDIDRALNFNPPPGTGTLFGGEFDVEAINAAYSAQEYTLNDINGLDVWCGPVGCAEGLRMDPRNRYMGRVFGDAFGRQQPVFASPEVIFSAGPLETVEAWADVYNGEADSLLDVPEYLAVGEALTAGEGSLLQAEFFLPSTMAYPLGPIFVQEEMDAILAVMEDRMVDYGSLPPYSLFVFADRQEADQQVTVLALTYADEDSARQAAAEVADRLQNFPDTRSGNLAQPIIEAEAFGGVMVEPDVYHSEAADRYVALIRLAYPMPDNTPVDGRILPSGLLHHRLLRILADRMMMPLWVELPE